MPEPVPAILLSRLAVDREDRGLGLGKDLLRDDQRPKALSQGSIRLPLDWSQRRLMAVSSRYGDEG
jgi:hypothetical protein